MDMSDPNEVTLFEHLKTAGYGKERMEALSGDILAIMSEEVCTQGQAEKILLKRIGGQIALKGYADCLVAGKRRRS